MESLKQPYEISVWDDVWDSENNKYIEKRVAIIGSNTMTSQNRALEPKLIRNVNGTKKLEFKMCKRYKDNVTGERVVNPFADYLISERKVKLKYDGDWFDFIVKNIDESSKDYIYSYQLEDALVNELSKNGFGVILDKEQQNNTDTAQVLAERILEGTGWKVESDFLVETEIENLVYINLPKDTKYHRIHDQTDKTKGVLLNSEELTLSQDTTVLAFYSSCRNKPLYFQFIMLDSYNRADVKRDIERVIVEPDCQYVIKPIYESGYTQNTALGQDMYLPNGAVVSAYSPTSNDGSVVFSDDVDGPLSAWYRGKRYVFSQKTEFEPQLQRYVGCYTFNNQEYRGYATTEYHAPQLIQNYITNNTYMDTSGWVTAGTYIEQTLDKNNQVISKKEITNSKAEIASEVQSILKPGSTTEKTHVNSIEFGINKGFALINSSLFDTSIDPGMLDTGSVWGLRIKGKLYKEEEGAASSIGTWTEEIYLTQQGTEEPEEGQSDTRTKIQQILSNFKFKLLSTSYDANGKQHVSQILNNAATNGVIINEVSPYTYFEGAPLGETFDQTRFFKVDSNKYASKKAYHQSHNVRLVITAGIDSTLTEMVKKGMITGAELFKIGYYQNGDPMLPGGAADLNLSGKTEEEKKKYNDEDAFGVTKDVYYYYPKGYLDDVILVDPDDFIPEIKEYSYQPNKYIPVIDEQCGKCRTVTAKESNYFNILQSIAETFEAWALIETKRNDTGAITEKKIRFTETAGQRNYASFRYGVNLKDIKRTYASKALVSKLIVKQNSNEFAKDGFCSISRSLANPIGEDFLYDFSYYFNTNMINAREYLDELYSATGAKGADVGGGSTNLNGYFLRLRAINDKMNNCIALIDGATDGLVQLKAEEAVEEAAIKSAQSEQDKATEEYNSLVIGSGTNEDIQEAYQNVLDIQNKNAARVSQANTKLSQLRAQITQKTDAIKEQNRLLNEYKTQKRALHDLFYKKYSRFIQEGTWNSEEYIDDDKYYYDAQSVLYNSCYPQVSYTINVLALSALPGYELFKFKLGDITYAEDADFFGDEGKIEVVLTEMQDYLDSPEKNQIKVQNFKDQFQDLFQKITATVQQAQYRTGSYEKAAALVEATEAKKHQFLTDALSGATAQLSTAGQQSVVWGNEGLIITDMDAPCKQLRAIGGAILLSKQDKNGQTQWTTGITADGVSASLITAGIINTADIQIMNGADKYFRLDKKGLTAYREETTTGFVRFDKHGIYGVAGLTENGAETWEATQDKINEAATFALTWDGLKVTGKSNSGGAAAKVFIGKATNIIDVTNSEGKSVFSVSSDGTVNVEGNINATSFTGDTLSVANLVLNNQRFTSLENFRNSAVSTSGISQINNVSASYGTIGGFTITSNSLYSQSRTNHSSINTPGILISHSSNSGDSAAALSICSMVDSIGYRTWVRGSNITLDYTGNPSKQTKINPGSIMFTGTIGIGISGNTGKLLGDWIDKSSIGVVSDANAKHEINPLSINYSKFFDSLIPCTYKYNDGTSGRIHTGFIAQEVKQALDIANISTKDFAGLVIAGAGTETEEWALRYEEFIALNTWQIQQLKNRVSYLENEVQQIKTYLKFEKNN